jgi:hypothetical protein
VGRRRRKLRDENTSFRKLVDELRTDMAIKYLRDTGLTVVPTGPSQCGRDRGVAHGGPVGRAAPAPAAS